jgi:hypothetical protein
VRWTGGEKANVEITDEFDGRDEFDQARDAESQEDAG